MHTGTIIDFYDDPHGHVLKTKLAAEQVPDFIKTAQFLGEEQRGKLPDDVYALVMIDQGEKMRKYACTDKGNTALSVIYFLENKDRLPEEAQKTAAANLLTACEWHDLQPPLPLTKTAGLFGRAMGALTMKDSISRGVQRHKNVVAGKPMMPKIGDLTGSEIMPLQGDGEEKVAGADKSVGKPTFGEHVKATAWPFGRFAKKVDDYAQAKALQYARIQRAKGVKGFEFIDEGDKMAAPYGNSVAKLRAHATKDMDPDVKRRNPIKLRPMPQGLVGVPAPNTIGGWDAAPIGSVKGPVPKYVYDAEHGEILRNPTMKKASMDPYVDVTGKSAPPRIEKVAHRRFALVKEGQGQFPIDSYGDVLEADRWFNDHGESLHPEDRRELCTKLAARADEIGCKVTDYVRKYAGAGFAPDGEVRVAVATRMQYFQDDSPERDMLNGLMDKYAHVSPDVFCEAVKQFDEATGLDYHWDDGVYDPWYTTYGFVKEAAWEFSTHGSKINEEQLKQVVNAGYMTIKKKFGDDMADSLKKSPVQIFDSLPLDTKRIIMRMANDPQPSPA